MSSLINRPSCFIGRPVIRRLVERFLRTLRLFDTPASFVTDARGNTPPFTIRSSPGSPADPMVSVTEFTGLYMSSSRQETLPTSGEVVRLSWRGFPDIDSPRPPRVATKDVD
jgi:hypothetical protein